MSKITPPPPLTQDHITEGWWAPDEAPQTPREGFEAGAKFGAAARDKQWLDMLAQQVPIGFMSEKQVPLIKDPGDEESGRYIPMRKTPAGNFTLALYAAPVAQQAVPAGYKLVPVEPTLEMLYLGGEKGNVADDMAAKYRSQIWAAMLAAVPEKPAPVPLTDEQRDAALNVLCRMFSNSEEVEGPDGMAMLVPLDLWHEAQEALDELIGEDGDERAHGITKGEA